MKGSKFALMVVLILAVGIFSGCAKKAVRSDAATYTPSRVIEPKPSESKPEASSPDQTTAAEREKKLPEEDLREEELRQKALREKALREEAARKEAAAREAALMASKLESVLFEFDRSAVESVGRFKD